MTLTIFKFLCFWFFLFSFKKKRKSIIPFFRKPIDGCFSILYFKFLTLLKIINYFSPIDQCCNKHFNWSFIGNLQTCPKFTITMMLLLIVIVHLSYFHRKALSSGGCENNRGLTPSSALFLCCCSGTWWTALLTFFVFSH